MRSLPARKTPLRCGEQRWGDPAGAGDWSARKPVRVDEHGVRRLSSSAGWQGCFESASCPETASKSLTNDEQDLLAFLHDRLKVHLRDQGIRHDIIDAVLTMPGSDDLVLVVKRAEALAAFLKTEDGTNLLQGLKRTNNILTQAEDKDGVEYSFGADPKYADTDQERALFAALDAAEPAIRAAVAAEDFPPPCPPSPPCGPRSMRSSRRCRSTATTRSCAATG